MDLTKFDPKSPSAPSLVLLVHLGVLLQAKSTLQHLFKKSVTKLIFVSAAHLSFLLRASQVL